MFKVTVPNFYALVDLEMAIESEIERLDEYRYLSEREQESRDNLVTIYREVRAMRAPITAQLRQLNN